MIARMDPLTAAAAVMVVVLVAYNVSSSPEKEDNLTIDSFWCLGICAKLDGEHHSPATEEEEESGGLE